MLGFHWPELFVVLCLAALLLGPKRFPEIDGAVGRTIANVRKGMDELKEETGIEEMRHDLTAGLSQLKDESGLDDARRELSSLNRPRR